MVGSQVGSVAKNPPANVGGAGSMGSSSGSGRFPGAGNGNLFQDSCLENSMDRGAWRAKVHGIVKSWTQLNTTTLSLFYGWKNWGRDGLNNLPKITEPYRHYSTSQFWPDSRGPRAGGSEEMSSFQRSWNCICEHWCLPCREGSDKRSLGTGSDGKIKGHNVLNLLKSEASVYHRLVCARVC